MITKILFPVTDSSNLNFEHEAISDEEYSNMFIDNFQKNKHTMDNFEKYGFSYKERNMSQREEKIVKDSQFYSEIEVFIAHHNNEFEITDSFFTNHVEDEKMFLLKLNVNPNSLDFDTEDELRLWIGMSENILTNEVIDEKTKISSLPHRDIKIILTNGEVKMLNKCKLIKNCSDKKYPYNIIIIIEKITNF